MSNSGHDIDEERYRAPALDKGLDILELLAQTSHPMSRSEIVKAMGRSPGEIYRMLERLVVRRYVTRSVGGDRYALSLKLFAMGALHPPMERLTTNALPVMHGYCKAVEQSCHMSVEDRGNLLVIAHASGPASFGIRVRAGARISLTDSASGHVMLAFQSEERRAHMIEARESLDGESRTGPRQMRALLQRIRKQGWWQGPSRQARGVMDLSVPVLGPRGEAVAVLTSPYLQRIDAHPSKPPEVALSCLLEASRTLSMGKAVDGASTTVPSPEREKR